MDTTHDTTRDTTHDTTHDTTYEAATFTASRDELRGEHPLLGSAEIARDICRRAHRTVSVLAITPERMRRVDGWLGEVGFVTHAAAPDDARPLLGSVCDRDRASALVRSIVGSLVGELPAGPAGRPVDVADLAALSPDTLPVGVAWLAIVTAVDVQPEARRHLVFADAGGLVVASVRSFRGACRLNPGSDDAIRLGVDDLVGSVPRRIDELLGD